MDHYRAIPLAIFQAEPSVKKHYLTKWLKAPGLTDFDIRNLLDWDYYIERFGSAVQKIITIPAALQGVANPVPRVGHPDWLHKRMLEKNDVLKQKKINEIFATAPKKAPILSGEDIEDGIGGVNVETFTKKPLINRRKRTKSGQFVHDVNSAANGTAEFSSEDLMKNWRDVLGNPPKMGQSREEIQLWLAFQKRKWSFMQRRKAEGIRRQQRIQRNAPKAAGTFDVQSGMTSFIQKTAQGLMSACWQVIQIVETTTPGLFTMWVLIGSELHRIKLKVPRIFFINQKTPKPEETGNFYRKVHRTLPRANEAKFLYEYRVPEEHYLQHMNELYAELSVPEVEGIYETQVPLMFRALIQIGCLCQVSSDYRKSSKSKETDSFELDSLEFRTLAQADYLNSGSLKHIYLYHYSQDSRSMFGLFIPGSREAHVYVVDRARVDNLPDLKLLYNKERKAKIDKGTDAERIPAADHTFETVAENNIRQVYRSIQRHLQAYKDKKRGPTLIAIQSPHSLDSLTSMMPYLLDFPCAKLHVTERYLSSNEVKFY